MRQQHGVYLAEQACQFMYARITRTPAKDLASAIKRTCLDAATLGARPSKHRHRYAFQACASSSSSAPSDGLQSRPPSHHRQLHSHACVDGTKPSKALRKVPRLCARAAFGSLAYGPYRGGFTLQHGHLDTSSCACMDPPCG